jgi:IMP dehydrogenase
MSSQSNGHHANTNGNASTSHLPPRDKSSFASPSDAMKLVEEYARGDGLSLAELMDSRKNGGLTYNDFLMLPGHISFPASIVSLQTK